MTDEEKYTLIIRLSTFTAETGLTKPLTPSRGVSTPLTPFIFISIDHYQSV